MASRGQASFARQWCALSRDGEPLKPSLQNLGAITGMSYSRWHPPPPAQHSSRGAQPGGRWERSYSPRSHQQGLAHSLLLDPWKRLLITFLPDTR